MENQAQSLFLVAFAKLVLDKYIIDCVLQSCIAPQFEIPVLLVAMNTVNEAKNECLVKSQQWKVPEYPSERFAGILTCMFK